MCFCWSNLDLRTLSALSFSFPFLVVIIHNTHTPCSLSPCQLLQPVASLNMLLSFSLSIALSKWQHVNSLPTPPQKIVPRSAWQLKALHSQHSSKLVRVLFAFRLLRCVLSTVCVFVCFCVCFFVCVCVGPWALCWHQFAEHTLRFICFAFVACHTPPTPTSRLLPRSPSFNDCPTERCSNDAHYAI